MTKHAVPDLLDLAEAVARGDIRLDDAEQELRAVAAAGDGSYDKSVRELRGLVLATSAVHAHAAATRDASTAEEPEMARVGLSKGATVPGAVIPGTVRRRSLPNGDSRGPRRTWLLLAATLAIGTGVIGISLAGGNLIVPNPVPTATNTISTAVPSAAPTQSSVAVAPSPLPGPAMFAYIQPADGNTEGRLWVANLDGTGAHALVPDLGGNQQAPVWSDDGTRLLFSRAPAVVGGDGYPSIDFRLYLTDTSGNAPQQLDTDCVSPCLADSDAAFSQDGTRIVFVRKIQTPPPADATPGIDHKLPGPGEKFVLATMDLASGRVLELASTTNPKDGSVLDRSPSWSADGTQIVFTQDNPDMFSGPKINGDFAPDWETGLFVVDTDGTDLRQLSLRGWPADWSPDGTSIVFQSVTYKDYVSNPGRGTGYTYTPVSGIYTIAPDGTDLRQLIADGVFGPSWTSDGRILFGRFPIDAPSPTWIMDADGSNARQLGSTAWLGLPNQAAVTALTGR